jgi:hypothetical protein
MLCPTCKDEKLVMSERKGVEIDYCPQCRGVWLDRGELDKIIEKSTSEQATSQPQSTHSNNPVMRQEQQGYNQGYQKHYKKKSIWHELFD